MDARIAEPRADLVPAALLDQVVAYFRPRRVILDDDAPREMLTSRAGYEARKSYLQPADVIPCREAVFVRKARIPGTLSHEAALEGIVIYERLPP